MPRSTTQKPTGDPDAPVEGAGVPADAPIMPAEQAPEAEVAPPTGSQVADPSGEGKEKGDPEPDKHGRLRVLDRDTGHKLTINAPGLPHGNFTVLNDPASDDLTGQPLPPEYAEAPPKSAVETTPDGL